MDILMIIGFIFVGAFIVYWVVDTMEMIDEMDRKDNYIETMERMNEIHRKWDALRKSSEEKWSD